jgi:flagellin
MMYSSINTNSNALIALQNLNATSMELSGVQSRINTGKKVNSAKDNGATWAIAQNQRSDIASLDAVKESLSRGSSTIDVAMSAATSVSDLLVQMKQKVLSASDTSLDAVSRSSLNEDFKSLRDQITKAVTNASFNGKSLLNTGSTAMATLANADGSSRLTVAAEVMTLSGSIVTLTSTASFNTAATASALIATVNTSLQNVSSSLSRLGTRAKSLENHLTFVSKLQDALETGVGSLVDADLAKESARFQALQAKQQLGFQALTIANQGPQSLLSLFRQG